MPPQTIPTHQPAGARRPRRLRRLLGACAAVAATLSLICTAPVDAAIPAARLTVHITTLPTVFQAACPADYSPCDTLILTATDTAGVPSDGTPVTLTDTLPAGLHADELQISSSTQTRHSQSCSLEGQLVRCTFTGVLAPEDTIRLQILLTVEPSTQSAGTDTATVSGGGAPPVSAAQSEQLNTPPPSFAPSSFGVLLAAADGLSETQAGAHPYELSARIDLNTVIREDPEGRVQPTSVQDLRDLIVDLPPGLLASATAAPTCTFAQLDSEGETARMGTSGCPADTAVGHIQTEPEGFTSVESPIYNLLPERGVPAQFGILTNLGTPVVLSGSLLPTPEGYVLQLAARELPQVALTSATIVIYGDPAERDRSSQAPAGLLTLPSQCSGEPLLLTVHMDSWQAPGSYQPDGTPNLADPNWVSATASSPPVDGCQLLEGLFSPRLQAAGLSPRAASPTGLQLGLQLPPQEGGTQVPAVPSLAQASLTVPEGVMIDPSAASGLGACSLAQVGITPAGVPDAAPPACPSSSLVGSVEMLTPLIAGEACLQPGRSLEECPAAAERHATPLAGYIYLAEPYVNPFASLLALYLVIDDARTGVIVKIPARVSLNPQTGQLTVNVPAVPQLPFRELRLNLFAGSDALLQTPEACGPYELTGQLTPWSGAPATVLALLQISEGPGGGACQGPGPFAPALTAGSSDAQAGAFSPFTVTLSRQDTEQPLRELSVTTPPGLMASLKGVVRCPEPQAAHGECGPESLLGQATIAAGAGPAPYWLTGGRVYLTDPYNGGPFGLSIVIPADAGPFQLGTVVVRTSIRIDPRTAQITLVSDELPQMIDTAGGLDSGIPVDLRTLQITLNRPGFIINPTDCDPLAVSAQETSTLGATADSSTPFYASGCRRLRFTPKLTVSTQPRPSSADGVSMTFKLAYPKGALGTQSSFSQAKFDMPRQLSVRLATIQHACLASVFETNPAACPSASVIGRAVLHTPILSTALAGPVYFISNGAARFPEVLLVLQAEGVTVDVHGATSISKSNVTSVDFKDLPDVPLQEMQLTLPAGPNSEFAANLPAGAKGSFCAQRLLIPTLLAAQDGAVIHQSTPIAVSGCPEPRKAHKGSRRRSAHRASAHAG